MVKSHIQGITNLTTVNPKNIGNTGNGNLQQAQEN